MFNFSANNLKWISTKKYDKCNVHVLKDTDTNRCYKVYDYVNNITFEAEKKYSISGKVNSADKLYLILERFKEKLEITKNCEKQS